MINPDKIITFDFETTGINPNSDLPIQFAAINGDDVFEVYLKTDKPLGDVIVALTGITNEFLGENGEVRHAGERKILEYVKNGIDNEMLFVAASAVFDVSFLYSMAKRNDFEIDFDKILIADILVFDRILNKYRKGSRTVSTIAPSYGVTVSENMHNAVDDVRVEQGIFLAQLASVDPKDTVQSLSEYNTKMGLIQQRELYDYFVKTENAYADNFNFGYPIWDVVKDYWGD